MGVVLGEEVEERFTRVRFADVLLPFGLRAYVEFGVLPQLETAFIFEQAADEHVVLLSGRGQVDVASVSRSGAARQQAVLHDHVKHAVFLSRSLFGLISERKSGRCG